MEGDTDWSACAWAPAPACALELTYAWACSRRSCYFALKWHIGLLRVVVVVVALLRTLC